jgi:hypothetical protein
VPYFTTGKGMAIHIGYWFSILAETVTNTIADIGCKLFDTMGQYATMRYK